MFKAILYTQWKWTRIVLLPCTIIAFALPVVSVREVSAGLGGFDVNYVMQKMVLFSVWYPVLAAAVALSVAVSAWREDHLRHHVYALSLPVHRSRFALLRFAAGAVLLVAPILAMWVGALIASAAASIPVGLRAYPTALAVRFALAAFVAYAIFFAISAGTIRSAGIVLATLGGVAAVGLLLTAAGLEFDLLGFLMARLLDTSGPFSLFTGQWVLIDV